MTTASNAKAKVATFEGGGDDMDLPLVAATRGVETYGYEVSALKKRADDHGKQKNMWIIEAEAPQFIGASQ